MEHDEEAVTCTPHGATESRKQWKKRCPLCREGYSGPRILPCFHTFCLECLQFLAAIWPLVPGNEGEKPSFFCPVCKTLTLVPELGVEDFNVGVSLRLRSTLRQCRTTVRQTVQLLREQAHRRTGSCVCMMRIAHARFLSDTTRCPVMMTKTIV